MINTDAIKLLSACAG